MGPHPVRIQIPTGEDRAGLAVRDHLVEHPHDLAPVVQLRREPDHAGPRGAPPGGFPCLSLHGPIPPSPAPLPAPRDPGGRARRLRGALPRKTGRTQTPKSTSPALSTRSRSPLVTIPT